MAGDLNKANLKKVLSHYHQHITVATRGERTLDHCYSTVQKGYKALLCPPFGKSDHISILQTQAEANTCHSTGRQSLDRAVPHRTTTTAPPYRLECAQAGL